MKVIAIGTDPSETADTVRSYRDNQGITYRMAAARTDIVRAYNITTQSSKVGVDRNGIVQVRSGPGTRGDDWWQNAFNTLLEQPAASTAPSAPEPTEKAASVPASPPSTPLVRSVDPEPTKAATAAPTIRAPTAVAASSATATPDPPAPTDTPPPPPTDTPTPPTPTPQPTATPVPTDTPVPPPPPTEPPSLKVGYNVGEMAPDFELTTIDGETLSLSDFRGSSPVLLYFYATW